MQPDYGCISGVPANGSRSRAALSDPHQRTAARRDDERSETLIGARPIEMYSEQRLHEFDEAETGLAAVLNWDRADQQIAVPPAPTLDVPPFPCRRESRSYVRLAGTRPGGRPTFLLVQESRQRSTPRLPGPTGCPRYERSAGPVAKLAGQKAAGVGQRDRTSPGEPSSLGGSEGEENRRE